MGRELGGDVLRYPPKPEKKLLFAIRDGWRIFCLLFSAHQRPSVFYHTPGQLPPYDTGHGDGDFRVGRSP